MSTTYETVVVDYLEAQYPGIRNDCIEYHVDRNADGEVFVTLRLVYNASKLKAQG